MPPAMPQAANDRWVSKAGKYRNDGRLAAVCVFGSGIFPRLGLLAGH